MKQMRSLLGIVGCCSLLACGGGGGGSSSGNYSGTWDISAVRVINDCGVALPYTFTNTIIVNQSEGRIVVNSGNRVLQGEVNDEDGFVVTDVLPPSGNCALGAAYAFRDASDGEADVGVAIIARCGVRECNVGYGGSATRRDLKMLSKKSAAPATNMADIHQSLADSVLAGGGDEAKAAPAESAAELAALVAPAS
jgi:hypothetical protein